MNKFSMARLAKNSREIAVKHGSEILTGIGIAGMITTTVLAVRATPKALELIDKQKYELQTEELTPVEVVKATWKCYIPAVVTGVASTTCLIGASSMNTRRTAAITAAYKVTETALNDYREKVVETIGEKKEKIVRDKVAKKQLDENPVTKSEVIITDGGETLCFDPFSSRYFKSDIDKIRKAENNLNKRMIHDICGYASLNDFYDELGLAHTELGDTVGWNTDNLIELDIGSHITDNGKPCITVGHFHAPSYDYY